MDWNSLFDLRLLHETLFKLLLASLLGGMMGFERESHGQAAGFRTYILIGVGSCLMMMVSLHMVTLHAVLDAQSAVRLDPGRLASYTLSGMGFLGAGAIIVGKGSVKGLTTAAGMWTTTGVGLAVGSGYILPAVVVTLISLFSLYVLRRTKPLFKRDMHSTITIVSEALEGQGERIEALVRGHRFSDINLAGLDQRLNKGLAIYEYHLVCREDQTWKDLTRELSGLPGVRRVAREEGKVP